MEKLFKKSGVLIPKLNDEVMRNNDFSYKEKEAIGTLLGDFAQTLYNRETAAIADLSDQQAVFIPDGIINKDHCW